ncbi:MAG TPA: hypothetical protein VIM84_05195, partial [Gemmatimonadales bacterium]
MRSRSSRAGVKRSPGWQIASGHPLAPDWAYVMNEQGGQVLFCANGCPSSSAWVNGPIPWVSAIQPEGASQSF